MNVNQIDIRTFQLISNEKSIGKLIYKGLFSNTAEIIIPNSGSYEIKPLGFFKTSISVIQNSTEIASLKMNWKGQIVISFKDDQDYIFKVKGILRSKYFIEDEAQKTLLNYNPKLDLNNFRYNYDISFDIRQENILLILIGIYAANYNIAVASGAIAAT